MIHLQNVQFSYGNTPMSFELQLPAGSKTAIIGASGCGKSTLLNLIAGFIYPSTGQIYLNNYLHTHTPPHQRPVSMLFQDNNLFTHLSVLDNMALGLQPNLKLDNTETELLHTVAEQVGLSAYLSRRPEQLSGGQKQRISLARCLLREQPILLLDEPFSALDTDLRQEMLALLANITEKKSLTLLLVTHQPDEVSEFVDQTLNIDGNYLHFKK